MGAGPAAAPSGRRPVSCTPEPPSLLYIHSWPVRAAMTYCPSADQMGDAELIRSLFVSARALEPSALAVQTFFGPLRSRTNAIWAPSGEYRGCWSHPGPPVMRVAMPPAMGSV